MVHSEKRNSKRKLFWGMLKIKKLKKMILCAMAILFLSCLAVEATSLGTVDIAHTGFGAHGVIDVWGGGDSSKSVYGGVYMLNKTAGTGGGNTWPDGLIGSFCFELSEVAPDGTLTYDVVMPQDGPVPTSFLPGTMGSAKAGYLAELWAEHFDKAWADTGGSFTPQQNSDAKAFAAAVWEIVYEDIPESPEDWDVTQCGVPCCNSGFRCENADTATANSWLRSLDGIGPKADLRAFVYDGKQDYISEVPEPSTVALLGLGCVVSLLRRKKAIS